MKKITSGLFNPASKARSDNEDAVYTKLAYALAALTLLIITLLICFLKCNMLTGVVTFIAVAGASTAGGAALGFIFGLPRSEKYRFVNKDDVDHNAKEYSYGDNTNLEEVSDWLTKIIVGLTLIKWRTIIGWINLSAHSIEHTFKAGCGDLPYLNAYVLGYSTIILYFLAGAGICYIWARTNLSLIFTKAKIAQLSLEKQQLIAQVQALANPAINATGPKALDDLQGKTSSRTLVPDGSVQQFKNVIQSIYNAKPILDKTDLQKGRWGGRSQVGDKVLEALYNPNTSFLGLYRITVRVRILNTEQAVNGNVAFFLHDTFPSEIVYTAFDNNLAEINITAWEAFVAGARLEDGTELELDLNHVKGFPDGFYWKA